MRDPGKGLRKFLRFLEFFFRWLACFGPYSLQKLEPQHDLQRTDGHTRPPRRRDRFLLKVPSEANFDDRDSTSTVAQNVNGPATRKASWLNPLGRQRRRRPPIRSGRCNAFAHAVCEFGEAMLTDRKGGCLMLAAEGGSQSDDLAHHAGRALNANGHYERLFCGYRHLRSMRMMIFSYVSGLSASSSVLRTSRMGVRCVVCVMMTCSLSMLSSNCASSLMCM